LCCGLRQFANCVVSLPKRFLIWLGRAALRQQFGLIVAEPVRVWLPELLTPAVPVQVAVCADVHDEIEYVRRASKMAWQLVSSAPRSECDR
jgi:hypothetical protein